MSGTQSQRVNRRIVLASRPRGAPVPGNFRLEEHPAPEPPEGQLLLRTLYLSIDPYMRGRMSEGPSYAPPVPIGGVMVGGAVCRVEVSRHPDYRGGELVLAYPGWQDYSLASADQITRLDPAMTRPSYALGVLGMPGFTAYVGLRDIGTPRAGETVVVAAATGAVGSVVGQIAKIDGCRVVGVAGGPEKCRFAVEELGFDACIDHRAPDFPQQLAAACPKGIDVYFENVGGAVFDAVFPLLNVHARVPVCGLIAQYNAERLPDGPDRRPLLLRDVLTRRIRLQGFLITDHGGRFPEFYREMSAWVAQGRVRTREHLIEGLENAPAALIGMLEGRNFGKVVVRVSA